MSKYEFVDSPRHEIPGQDFRLNLWPRRDALPRSIEYCEWLDWAEMFAAGADEKLQAVGTKFHANEIYASGVALDDEEDLLESLRLVKIKTRSLIGMYTKAIWDPDSMSPWDPKSMSPSGSLAAAARITFFWDTSQRWLIICDRYFEIALFAIFELGNIKKTTQFFEGLDDYALIERFSRILRISRVAAYSEVERWKVQGDGGTGNSLSS